MKRSCFFVGSALVATSVALIAAPPGKRGKNRQEGTAVDAPVAPPVKVADTPLQWHTWTASSGEKLEAKFKALENGVVTVERQDKRVVRFPIARLSAEDQEFARACKSLQPRPPLAQEVIAKAAARIDESIQAGLKRSGTAANPPASDAQWVRRVYLDTIGRIPTEEEARTFLADRSPDKRATLINKLLDSPGYTMHMFNWLADLLRVKDDYEKGARAYLYEDWLKDQIAMNRPWDAMVRDMLTADGKLNQNGAAGFLLRDAQMPLDGVSNMLTTFLGANVACAQCHDHPFADWSQRDFYSMAAFFGATDGFHEDVFRKSRRLAKNAPSPADKCLITQLLVPNAFNLVDLPSNRLTFPADYKYKDAKPGEVVKPELIRWSSADNDNPAYRLEDVKPSQLRDQFAAWMVHPDNPRFAANIANRIWKKVFGIAVQEPVADLDDPEAASNPELLRQLTTYMKQAKFDLREFQRILFNTAAYQRQASEVPEDPKTFRFPGPTRRRMSAEQAWDSIITLTCGDDADHLLFRRGDDLRETVIPDNQINARAITEMVADVRAKGNPMRGAGGGKKNGGNINPRALVSFYEGGRPQIRSGLLLARASELPQPAPETHFLRLFGQSERMAPDSNTTDGSVPQMLQLMNGPVQEMITGGSVALASATKATTPAEKVSSLYLSFLGRQPDAAESTKAVAALNNGLGLADLAWVLLNSREFLFVP